MSSNFTPLPSSASRSKGTVNVNMVLIIIALVITILLGAFMWFLIVQKQQEEKNAQIKFDEQSKLRIAKQAELDKLPVATPSANFSITPPKVQPTVTPMASPSTLPTSGQATITP